MSRERLYRPCTRRDCLVAKQELPVLRWSGQGLRAASVSGLRWNRREGETGTLASCARRNECVFGLAGAAAEKEVGELYAGTAEGNIQERGESNAGMWMDNSTGTGGVMVMGRDVARELEMAEMFKAGNTLQAIGDKYEVSRERVRQLIGRHGLSRKDGGELASDKVNENYGMTARELKEAREKMPGCTRAYHDQQRNAALRGIEWDISFREWLQLWDGLWEMRGRGHGLVMCRRKDQGPYKVGNVFIATGSFNNAAYAMRKWHGIDIDDDPYYARKVR
jgi:hypothetical protein